MPFSHLQRNAILHLDPKLAQRPGPSRYYVEFPEGLVKSLAEIGDPLYSAGALQMLELKVREGLRFYAFDAALAVFHEFMEGASSSGWMHKLMDFVTAALGKSNDRIVGSKSLLVQYARYWKNEWAKQVSQYVSQTLCFPMLLDTNAPLFLHIAFENSGVLYQNDAILSNYVLPKPYTAYTVQLSNIVPSFYFEDAFFKDFESLGGLILSELRSNETSNDVWLMWCTHLRNRSFDREDFLYTFNTAMLGAYDRLVDAVQMELGAEKVAADALAQPVSSKSAPKESLEVFKKIPKGASDIKR